jgi:hypothetical protein
VKRQALIFLGGAALLLVLVLQGILDPSADRLPGIDSGNIYGWEVYTRSVLADWKLPFWNPYHFAGTPHLADPQTTVLYPPAMLLRWLPVPAFLGWMLALHLWIAGAGTWFAARTIGAGWMTASAAGVATMLGGSVPGWIHGGHLLVIYSAAWVPWALGLAIVSARSGRLVPDGRLVAVLVMQFLTGYLQGSLYLGAAVALYFVFSAAWPPSPADGQTTRTRRWTPLAQLAVLGLVCAAAAAFQLLPTAVLVAEAGRSGGLPYHETLEGSWQGRDLATLLFPFYGITEDPPFRMLPDRLAYVGWMLIAFAPFAFFSRERLRSAVFLGVLAAVTLTVALGDAGGLYRFHYALFPGLRVPGRILFLATAGFALLGALGLEAFVSLAARREWIRLAVPAAISGVGGSLAAYTALSGTPTPILPVHGWPWLPIVLAVGVLTVVAAGVSGWRRLALVTALAAVVADLTTLSLGAVGTVPVETDSEIRRWIGPPDGGRAVSLCENRVSAREFLQNREPTVDGLPGLHLRDYADWAFIAKSGDVPPGGLYHRIGSEGEQPARRDLIDMANVSRIVACERDADGRFSGIVVHPNEHAWPRATWVCGVEEVSRRDAIARILRGRYDASGRLQPRRYIKLRWAATVDDARRAELEQAHHLQDGVVVEEETWKYLLGDASLDAVLAIMRDPDVEDTHGVDRATGAFMPTEELRDSIPAIPGDDTSTTLLPATTACPGQGRVDLHVMDQPDGRVVARVDAPSDGHVFFSEPYYTERRATVDGRRVPMSRANLTFTAVAVPAGQHEVELRYTPSSFYLGSLVSGATVAGYAFAFVRRPRRKGR